eukprot:SAG31_NODE_46_length_30980_cov_226.095107_4_plen_141_part_00
MKLLLMREVDLSELPRLWEACWAVSAAELMPAASESTLDDGSQKQRQSLAVGITVAEDFCLYCCAAILGHHQKKLLESEEKSLVAIWAALKAATAADAKVPKHILTQDQCRAWPRSAAELVSAAAVLARGDVATLIVVEK